MTKIYICKISGRHIVAVGTGDEAREYAGHTPEEARKLAIRMEAP